MIAPARAVTLRALVFVVPVLLGGCFLAPWSPERPAPGAFSGPAIHVDGCQTCHPTGTRHAEGLHAAAGIRCGQCHTASNHPDTPQTVTDATCAGCHQPQFQQTLASRHFATRATHAFEGDRAAQAALRQGGFIVAAADGPRFAGDAASGELGGRLCAACHFDEHRLGLGAVRREDFCLGCHADREGHFPVRGAGPPNRCVQCHVRVGETVTGQVVDTHRFGVPGAEGSGR